MIQVLNMEILTGQFVFPPDTGARSQVLPFPFDKQVRAAHVALSGYDATYTSEDHHIKKLKVMLSTRLGLYNGFGVQVVADFHLRDRNDDDPFRGSIDFVLFVEFVSHVPPVVMG